MIIRPMSASDAAISLRGLAGVIRKHGTCAPMALEVIAERLEATPNPETNAAATGMGDANAAALDWINSMAPPHHPTQQQHVATIKAALAAQPALAGEVTVVQDDHGNVVAVTRTDSEHRVLSVIWEREQPAPVVGGVDGVARLLADAAGHGMREKCEPLARQIVELLAARPGGDDPIGWVFQHDETGRTTFCPNDGVNNPDSFAANNPRFVLTGPAYAHPAQAGGVES